ncbi:FAD-dependent oxidoreductase [Natrinema versiforme]|uniref:Fumarate reductase/succinate dehydrogenase flavoprotein domain protein n=1 Tax=Natrinema versiforme JCM 10478 TaxID=1227496 RepID=L9XMH3_9EURY|nr:FAD-dependent oxidoreductase [Natrinema versiforme]ELY62935.1 fumarate reductase/succinate dehydrogenase flavoprotein domain protein [Natrinema versiforme JCM 10478]
MSTPDYSRRTIEDATPEVVSVNDVTIDVETNVLVAGGGGTGLVAALAASERTNGTVTVLEKSDRLGGNTSLSTGMIPAAGTRFQRDAGIEETADDMARDILEKNDYEADEEMVRHLCAESKHLVHWLVDDWDITLRLVDDFKYPQHSAYRMHAPPGRNGEHLIDELAARIEADDDIELLTNTPVTKLVADGDAVAGAVAGETHEEVIGAGKVVLATDGFAGNRRMVENNCGEIADALYFGSDGNTGDGIRWGAALDAEIAYMDSFQGHATVVQGTGALSTYAVIMNGGVLVNEDGERFGNEAKGYSALAIDVVDQPGGVGYELFDERIFEKLRGEFDDFDEAVDLGSYVSAPDIETLAAELGCDPSATAAALESYNEAVRADEPDSVGRVDGRAVLEPPFYGATIVGSLFHTQGGLLVDEHGRVLQSDGSVVDNLYAGGGTAAGISGHGADGYLSGNGLTTALGLGRLAGRHAGDSLEV